MDPAYRKAPKPAALPLALALALTLVFAVGGAQAQLIKDDEARKAIADLDQRFQSDQAAEATRVAARQAELAQLTEQLALLRKSVAEMAAEISRLQEEAVRLRAGRAETAQRIATLQRQHEQEQQALAARMAALEPATLQVDGQALRLPPQQARGYEEAMKHIKAADYDKAAAALAGFLRRFPGSPAAPSVRYWLGNALYPLKNFSEASAQFRALPASNTTGTLTATGCIASSQTKEWCPTTRNNVQLTAEYIGVWVQVTYTYKFKFIGSTRTIERDAVMRLEPTEG